MSRTFTLFKERGLITLPRKRRVEILRPDELRRLAAADRDALPVQHVEPARDLEVAAA